MIVAPTISDSVLVDQVGGVSEYVSFDDVDKTFTVEKRQDVEPILEDAKTRHLDHNGKNKAGDFYHAGRFPVVLVENWLKLRGLTMKDFKNAVIDDFLNDSDHSAFRIWQGRV